MSKPAGPTSTRSTRSWTMRACSAGNSSSHRGSSRSRAAHLGFSDRAAYLPCSTPGPDDDFGGAQHDAELADHRVLDVAGGQTTDGAEACPILENIHRDIITIEPAAAAGVRGRHGLAGGAEDQALEKGRRLGPGVGGTRPGALTHDLMHAVPEPSINDGPVFPGIGRAF